MKTDTEILEEVLKWAKTYAGEVTMYKELFCADDYAGGNIDDAWDYGFNDGVKDAANDILALIKIGRGEK